MIKLGSKVRDSITGYTGVVIARTDWLHGCTRITVQSQDMKDGKPVDSHTIDEPQLELLEDAAAGVKWDGAPAPAPKRGGPRPDVAPRATPGRR